MTFYLRIDNSYGGSVITLHYGGSIHESITVYLFGRALRCRNWNLFRCLQVETSSDLLFSDLLRSAQAMYSFSDRQRWHLFVALLYG